MCMSKRNTGTSPSWMSSKVLICMALFVLHHRIKRESRLLSGVTMFHRIVESLQCWVMGTTHWVIVCVMHTCLVKCFAPIVAACSTSND